MEPTRFDKFTKRLASGRSRRALLKGFIGGTAAVAVSRNLTSAADSTPAIATPESDQESWLLVVNFGDAEIVSGSDDPTRLTLTLYGIDSDAVAFTDHPQRQVTSIDLGQVASAINDAADDPLNAALTARMPLSRASEQVIVVLRSATFDENAGTLVIEADALGSDIEGTPVAIESGQTTDLRGGNLFIDSIVLKISTCAGRNESCFMRVCCPGLHCTLPFGAYCVKL